MTAFLEAFGGIGLAFLGAALAVGMSCIGSAKGVGMVGEGIQASVEASDVNTEVGYCGRIFETFTIAE